MFGSAWREENRQRKRQQDIEEKLIAAGLLKPKQGLYTQNDQGQYGQVDPNADLSSPDQSAFTPGIPLVGVEDKNKDLPKATMAWNPDTGKYELMPIPAGYSGINPVNPPNPQEKQTQAEKAAQDVHQQYLKAISGQVDMTDTLQKQMDAAAPILGLEPVKAPATTETHWYGDSTKPGVTYYKPKGTTTEDEWDAMAQDELKTAGAPITPGNIAEAKRQLKAQRKNKK